MNGESESRALDWVDAQGLTWRVELPAQRIIVRCGDQALDLPANQWRRDIHLSQHGSGYLLRFETFERTIAFRLSHEQLAPLLRHLETLGGAPPAEPETPEEPADSAAAAEGTKPVWPKVSALAVWAVICSALAFVPVWGWLPGLAVIVLLALHHLMVRRTVAANHSRALCITALVLLFCGTVVSLLTTWGLMKFSRLPQPASLFAAPSGQTKPDWLVIACGIVVIILSLSVHEAAHAISAWWLGDGTARSLGRVTLNPLAHIDPVGTILLPAILVWAGAPAFGYAKPVPVYVETLPRYRRAHILIAVAGPGSNLLMACVSLMLLLGMVCGLRLVAPHAEVERLSSFDLLLPVTASGFGLAPLFGLGCTFLKLAFHINVVLAIFNLIPIPPLDGSWVLEHLFPRSLGPLYAMIRPYGFLIFVVALYSDVFDYLMAPIWPILGTGLALLAAATGF